MRYTRLLIVGAVATLATVALANSANSNGPPKSGSRVGTEEVQKAFGQNLYSIKAPESLQSFAPFVAHQARSDVVVMQNSLPTATVVIAAAASNLERSVDAYGAYRARHAMLLKMSSLHGQHSGVPDYPLLC
jgi:hypothetical protein